MEVKTIGQIADEWLKNRKDQKKIIEGNKVNENQSVFLRNNGFKWSETSDKD